MVCWYYYGTKWPKIELSDGRIILRHLNHTRDRSPAILLDLDGNSDDWIDSSPVNATPTVPHPSPTDALPPVPPAVRPRFEASVQARHVHSTHGNSTRMSRPPSRYGFGPPS